MLVKITNKLLAQITLFFIVFFVVGCSATYDLHRYQQQTGSKPLTVEGERFTHLYLPAGLPLPVTPNLKPYLAVEERQDFTVTIYIEGDGRPYLPGGQHIASDPTPLKLPALSLMAMDPNPSIYLARPCYFIASEGCNSVYWTQARYSQQVVNSMIQAVENLQRQYRFSRVRLLGVSGGAAIASLMASEMDNVELLVTVAGNMDIEAWADLHGYQALSESLNPMKIEPETLPTCQLHMAGEKDKNIPSSLIEAFAREKGGQFRELPDYDHNCCWHQSWPTVLKWIYGN